MPDEFLVTCPFCGEPMKIYVEPDVNGSFVQDCEVCCNPWGVHVTANWHRSQWFADTGLPWRNPSPNLRSPAALNSR